MRNNTNNLSLIIEKWMDAITSDGGIDRFDDLHIDQISSRFSERSEWVLGGLQSFPIAREHAVKYLETVSLALALSLESSGAPTGADATFESDFCDQLDWSPPSLYWKGREPWKEENSGIEIATARINPKALFGDGWNIVEPECSCFLVEFKQERNDDYTRSVFWTPTR